jgi:hypothetical protein
MDIVLTLLTIWCGTFILSFLVNSAERSSQAKQIQKAEAVRQKKLDQLYGRD